MPEVTLFCEDSFHEKFIGALLTRFAREYQLSLAQRFFSARGGIAQLHGELTEFLRDLARDRQVLPDRLIVVVDANCKGHNERKNWIDDALNRYPQFQNLASYAIPDPHIERWMLVDPVAFRHVFSRGCTLPNAKCQKDEYKRILREEIRNSGLDAPLGGEEFAEDIVNAMDLSQVEIHEPSFGLFLRSLRGLFNGWRQQRTQD